jgi:hypothetical protein
MPCSSGPPSGDMLILMSTLTSEKKEGPRVRLNFGSIDFGIREHRNLVWVR